MTTPIHTTQPPTPRHSRRGGSLCLDARLTDPALGDAAGLQVRYVNPSDAACGTWDR